MYPHTNKNHHSNYPSESNMHGINNSNLSNETNSTNVRLTESKERYHLEMEIVGYVIEDFNFYITPNNDLVLTTAKSNDVSSNNKNDTNRVKHSYCYASALLRKTFSLPKNIVKNEIFVDYKNHILKIDLLKLKTTNI